MSTRNFFVTLDKVWMDWKLPLGKQWEDFRTGFKEHNSYAKMCFSHQKWRLKNVIEKNS